MIENNYYYYIKNKAKITILEFITLYGIINIQQPNNLYIFYNDKLEGFYYNCLCNYISNTHIQFIKIKHNYFHVTINKYMYEYGGIFIKTTILFLLRKINNFFNNDITFFHNHIFIALKKGTKMNNDNLNENQNQNKNLFKNEFIYIVNNNTYNLLNKHIYDYNFNLYFDIIYNKYIIYFENNININEDILTENILNSQINIFNLIIYYILGYTYYFNEIKLLTNNYQKQVNKLQVENIIDKVFYINLEKSKDRNKNMINLLNSFTSSKIINNKIIFERIEGLDGNVVDNIKEIYFEEQIEDNKSELICNNSNSEYAVLYSHLSLLQKIQNYEGKYFLILEDDLCFDFQNYWNKSVKEIIEEAPSDWEILMLGYFSLNTKFNTSYRKWNNEWSALSYIIKKSSLHKINSRITKNNKFLLFNDVNVADNYIFRLFNTYVYQYPLFTINNNNTSTFHKDHDNYQKIYKNLNLIILNNLIKKYVSTA